MLSHVGVRLHAANELSEIHRSAVKCWCQEQMTGQLRTLAAVDDIESDLVYLALLERAAEGTVLRIVGWTYDLPSMVPLH